jgi:hypothetical protein
MSLGASLGASLLATLTRPVWWALALAAFLLRGGLLVILVPIVALPTVAGLANAFSGALVGFVFGGPSVALLVAVGSIALLTLAWLIGGGVVAGWLDLVLVRATARDDELEGRPAPDAGGPGRAFIVRIVAHVPTGVVLALGAVRLVEASYEELTHPGDPAIPIPIRIALRIPEIVGLLAATWVVGEAVGGLSIRYLAWGASAGTALGRAIRSLLRPSTWATLAITDAVLAVVIFGAATAASVAWDRLRVVLRDGGTVVEVQLSLIVFAVAWVAGLWLISLAVAWRSAAWTFETARGLPGGTIEPRST